MIHATNKTSWRKRRQLSHARTDQRRGAALILIASMMIVFCITSAITIDYAYIQLVRTQMRAAADSAAKAGAEALARTEDLDEAREAAVRYAALNQVGRLPLQIRKEDVLIGRLEFDQAGRWEFREGNMPPNAVKVLARTGGDALHPAIPLFLPGIHGQRTIAPSYESTAGQQAVEVALCLDRSGSMLFDMSGESYAYPYGNPRRMSSAAWHAVRNHLPSSQWHIWRDHLSPPDPEQSRWAVLCRAIDLFLEEAGNHNPPPRTSLVTWSSNYDMPCPPRTSFSAAASNVPLPSFAPAMPWLENRAIVQGAVEQLGHKPMMGATNLSSGLDRAVAELTGPNSSAFASKVVILFTDGEWNEGRDPLEAAADARNAGIVVHCVVMLAADQPDIRQVAEMTGGRYYVTNNEEQLRTAFEELARSLPVVLTK